MRSGDCRVTLVLRDFAGAELTISALCVVPEEEGLNR